MENEVDEANRVNNSSCLHENDILGALLATGTKVHWKFRSLSAGWYVARNTSMKGRKYTRNQ